MRTTLLLMVTMLAVATRLGAQLSETMEVRVLEIEATVLDKAGRQVHGLSREDFQVRIGDREVPISNFFVVENGVVLTDDGPATPAAPSFVSPVRTTIPTNVVIFIDELHLSRGSRKHSLDALKKYVAETFDGSTVATVIRYYHHFDVRLRPTNRRADVLAELGRLELEPFADDAASERERMMRLIDAILYGRDDAMEVGGESPDTVFARMENYAEHRVSDLQRTMTGLEDAIALASAFRGRKVMLYVSDGLPQQPGLDVFDYWEHASQQSGAGYVWRQNTTRTDTARAMRFDRSESFRRLAETIQRADVAFYSFDAGGVRGYEGRGPDSSTRRARLDTTTMHQNLRNGLQYVAGETGGMHVTGENNLGKALVRMSEQFSSYYSIGVRPLPGEVRITVRNRPELRVLAARRTPPRTLDDEVDQNVRSRLYTLAAENPHQAKLHVGRAAAHDGRCAVPVMLEVPEPSLPPGVAPQSLDVRMVILNDQNDESPLQRFTGEFRDGRISRPMMLRIRPRPHVLSLAVTNPSSGETSYLQAQLDGTPCGS